MRTRTTTAALIAAGLLLTLTACGSEEDTVDAAPTQSAISKEDRDKAREAAGLPAEPNAEARKAFLDALNAIDTRIIKPGKEDQAVSRGLNQCSSIKRASGDEDKQVELVKQTLSRFTIDTRLPDIATPETGGEILAAVHQNLCPDF
ncbi:hypothetical protein ACFUIV_21270 [Streptomyces anulatus]|uniref:hypothetical protein n=1 Tax=Streptomyces anulatus TaxID=1892 RepID=UPI00363AA60F